jgi:hypothetical protein
MNIGALSKQIRIWLEHNVLEVLDSRGPVGELSPTEHLTIHGLIEVITDDATIPALECRTFVNEKTNTIPGALDAYRRAIRLLNESSVRHNHTDFSQLTITERDELLHRLFITFPHDEGMPQWARRVHLLSPHTLSLVFEVGAFRALRHHVMPELLSWYYTTKRGWAVVGWTDYPGIARRDEWNTQT